MKIFWVCLFEKSTPVNQFVGFDAWGNNANDESKKKKPRFHSRLKQKVVGIIFAAIPDFVKSS
jgi:hypothetical protein